MEAYMKNSNYSKAKTLTLIPIIILVVTVICFVLAAILEGPTGKGGLYTIFALAGLASIFCSPLPCLVMSIIGTIFASKAKKEGIAEARKYFILGIVEILVSVLGTFLAIIMFIAGQSV